MDHADANPTLTDPEDNDSESEDENGDQVQGGIDALDSPTAAKARVYSMNAPKRGTVLIFNHVKFDSLNKPTRSGSDTDVARLCRDLPLLGFKSEDIKVYTDLTHCEIKKTVAELQKDEELKQSDCVMVILLTHGSKYDSVSARDVDYDLHLLIKHFTPESLPSMAGKPKIFIVQACRGDNYDDGVLIRSQTVQLDQDVADSHKFHTIPMYADLIILMSSHRGHKAFRNRQRGTWLIRDFCKAIRKSNLQTTCFEDILMETKYLVSLRRSLSEKVEETNKKQAASVYSTAIRKVYFSPSKSN